MGNSTPLITNIYFISANVACPTQLCSSGLSQQAITCVFCCNLRFTLLCSGPLQKNLFKGR